MRKRTDAVLAVLAASVMLGACAKDETAAADRAAAQPSPPPAIGGTGPDGNAGGGLLPHRDNAPVDPGDVGGMRSKPTIPADTARSPPKP
jgi:hypothetical protein